MKEDTYFILTIGEDGDVFLQVLKESQMQAFLQEKLEEEGDDLMFVQSGALNSFNIPMEDFRANTPLIIRGEVVVPQAVEVTTKFKL